MIEINITGLILVGTIIKVLIDSVKDTSLLKNKQYIPFIAILMGIVFYPLYLGVFGIPNNYFVGAFAGALSVGGHEAFKAIQAVAQSVFPSKS